MIHEDQSKSISSKDNPPPAVLELQKIEVNIPTLGPGDRLTAGPNIRSLSSEIYRDAEELSRVQRPQSPDYHPSAHNSIQKRRRNQAISGSKKVSERAAVAEVNRELRNIGMNVVTTGIGAFVSQMILNLFSNSSTGGNGTTNPIHSAIANALVSSLSGSATKIAQLLVLNKVSPDQAVISAYIAHREMTTEAVKRRPQKVKEAIEKLDRDVDKLIQMKTNNRGEMVVASVYEKYLETRVLLLSLPYRRHITPGSLATHTPEAKAEFDRRLDEFVGTYPEGEWNRLRTYIQSIAAGRAQPALLHGPGGTGKTHFAKGVAKFLGVPIVTINVKDGMTMLYPLTIPGLFIANNTAPERT
jgi:hypothetical protein